MSHRDCHGNELRPGDEVLIRCRLVRTHVNPDVLLLRSLLPRKKNRQPSEISLDGCQIEFVGRNEHLGDRAMTGNTKRKPSTQSGDNSNGD